MVSSLAAQLAQSTSLNTALLVDKSRRKPTESYLFTPKEAQQHDLDSIHALGVNSFTKLATLDYTLRSYETSLFSDQAKALDRTLQPAQVVEELNQTLDSFLPLLGPYLLESSTGRVIEWLVRRFRIHEFNVRAILALFLPYHESPHFSKMLSILHITENSTFAPLLPFKTTTTPLSRLALVKIILLPQNSDFARFVAGILPATLQHERVVGLHRGLTAFHTSTLLEFIKKDHEARRSNVPDESTLAWYLPAASEPLRICSKIEVERSKEALVTETILSSFLILTALSHCCSLSPDALSALLKLVSACSIRVAPKHLIRTFIAICAPQDAAFAVVSSSTIVDTILKISGVESELKESLVYNGSDRLVGGILAALIPRLAANQDAFRVVDSLITYPQLPSSLTQSITTSLLGTLVSPNEDASVELPLRIRSLLVHIQQRYPDVLQTVFNETLKTDPEKKDILEQALLSLSMDLPGSSGQKLDSIVGSMSAESTVRVIALRELFEKLKTGSLEEIASIRSALLTRVQDTSASVLEALYSDPVQLLPIILEDPSAYLDNLRRALHTSTSPGRNVIKAHITFLSQHLFTALIEQDDGSKSISRLIFDIILPFALFSKPRQKTASAVWEIIEGSEISKYELLLGCSDVLKWETQATSGDALAKVNLAIAARIAESVFSSNQFADHTATFLSKLSDEDPHARLLSYLVIRSLIGRLSGERKLDVGLKAIQAMRLELTESMGDFMKGAENVSEVVDDLNLANAIFHKPSSRHTHHRLQASILVMLPNIRCPSGLAINWLNDDVPTDVRATKYAELVKSLYNLANTSIFPPVLAGHILRATLINLGEDSLKFLASVWVDSPSKANAEPAHYVALHHAAAFLEAHFATQHCIDFQTILPAVICALQHGDRRVRGAALECIGVFVKLSQMTKPIAVYAYDAIYGDSSDTIQYLDWADLSKYIQALGDTHEHILNDASYLSIFHQQHLIVSKRDSKKESGYKKRTLCYLLSHVSACGLPALKLSLLKSVSEISNAVKSRMLIPSIQSLSDDKLAARVSDRFRDIYEEYALLLASSFDTSAAEGLNESEGDSWTTYVQLLQYFFRSTSLGTVRKALAYRLQHGLFMALTLERKVDLCHLLLGLGQSDPDVWKECRDILIAVLTEELVIIHLLRSLQPNNVELERATKRAKVDSVEAVTEEKVTSLNAFADVLAASRLPGSLDLMVAILDTLTKLVHDVPAISADKVFAEQLLLSALENTANNTPGDVRIPATALRLDILVELIRVSENPQTFNQALLLMASLARLAPEAVLLNIMPIFTFMGSNVFHRDDSYSFRVVQKTIDSIVPVMISSLKISNSQHFDLYIASRAFLRIFTDAANHIPRHRRTAFFGQLVDALGPQDFLAPICMLLVDKMANRVIRQNAADARNSLTLSLTVIQRYPLELQLSALVEILREVHRSADNCLNATVNTPTFLELAPDDDRAEPSVASQRQAQSLLIFLDYAVQGLPSSLSTDHTGTHSPELLSSALDLASFKKRSEIPIIVNAAQAVVNSILRSMAAIEFVNGVQTVLQVGESNVRQGALELFGNNLSNVKDTSRTKASKVVIKIVDAIKNILLSKAEESLVVASFHALDAVTISMCPGEESALTTLVPVIVSYIRDGKSVVPALNAMSSLVVKLGPRVIPYFKDIVAVSVNVFRSPEPVSQALKTSVDILQGLLASIPKFWSKVELTQVLNAYFESSSSVARNHTPQMSALVKAVAKKAPTKVLLPLLCDMWTDVATGNDENLDDRLKAYWTALKRTIRAAPRPMVSEHLRSLFKTFLDAFGLFAERPDLRETIERDAISTFIELVVKINEASFKPLFRKLFDWAFNADSDSRKLVFCHIFSALLDYFKGLMTPYMTFLLQPFIGILEAFHKETYSADDNVLWIETIQTLSKTFVYDDGVYWRNDKLRQLLTPLVGQLSVSVRFNDNEKKTAISECLLGMAEAITDDNLLKSLNIDILMNTRSEDPRLRCQALICSEAMWKSHGGKLLGFVSETVTFVAEAAEDENDDVVRHALHLKNAIESVAGRIDV
ncbi:hypothetical protein QCA50_008072 [Cerrena zonata]|uniref:U3 small nucleolar RNA-associated protein 10 n=1 Tax=Cerrena zonata TaxID=2478898 RepID=A0AAW0GB54_9APHY